jgi:hypothetical protein
MSTSAGSKATIHSRETSEPPAMTVPLSVVRDYPVSVKVELAPEGTTDDTLPL